MFQWYKNIQDIVNKIDECIKSEKDDELTLNALSEMVGYSKFYTSRKFNEISGMTLKEYIYKRKLAFSLKELRDTKESILDIALKYGFSSNEAFTRAFVDNYGITPSRYRKNPIPLALRTIIKPFDCYLMEGKNNMINQSEMKKDVKVYYVRIPAHKFLHIRNYESVGYFDFWQKQSKIPGQDCETICGILDSIKGKLDDVGGTEENAGSGQLMAWINEPTGRICSWGIPLAEAYGVRLPMDYQEIIPENMMIMDVPEGEYIVFEHGSFDFETENQRVEEKIEFVMKSYDYEKDGYKLDLSIGRVFYFYHDCKRFFKYVRPVCRI